MAQNRLNTDFRGLPTPDDILDMRAKTSGAYMRRHAFTLLVCCVVLGAPALSTAQDQAPEPVTVVDRLPKDSLIAWSTESQDLAATWDEMIPWK